MANVKTIAEFFLVTLSFTYTLFSPIAPSKLTGEGFIKLISNLSIGSLVIAVVINLLSGSTLFQPLVYLKVVSIISLILISLFHKEDKSKLMWVLYTVVNVSLLKNIFLLTNDNFSALFLLSSSFLIGIITYAMTLGHWYLVVPKLSEKPLKVAAILTWVIMFVKIVVSTKSFLSNQDFFSENTILGSGYAFNWMMLLMRVLFGYVAIFGMSLFNYKLVKMRSIQSSTGILYAMTFFVFIGELASVYLFFTYGLFI